MSPKRLPVNVGAQITSIAAALAVPLVLFGFAAMLNKYGAQWASERHTLMVVGVIVAFVTSLIVMVAVTAAEKTIRMPELLPEYVENYPREELAKGHIRQLAKVYVRDPDDPADDSQQELVVYKVGGVNALMAIEASFVEQDAGILFCPYNGNELKYEEDVLGSQIARSLSRIPSDSELALELSRRIDRWPLTSGRWFYDELDESKWILSCPETHCDSKYLCELVSDDEEGMEEQDAETARNNMRLMASSKRMLELLKEMRLDMTPSDKFADAIDGLFLDLLSGEDSNN